VPDNKGGESLIKNLYKKKSKVNVPLYIIGLTQFPELTKTYNGIWKVWLYDPSLEEWKNHIRDLIHHVSLVKTRLVATKQETIFVEGPSDKKVIDRTLQLFYPALIENIYVDTINYGGGASWVERQLFIWAKSLNKKDGTTDYLKAVGIFDDDKAGKGAIANIRKNILPDTAESKTFSTIKNSYRYSPLLKGIKAKGIAFPTTLEDLAGINVLKKAMSMGMCEPRPTASLILDYQILPSLKETTITEDSLKACGFTDDECLIVLNKISDENKVKFSSLACAAEKAELLPISYQLQEILEKLKLAMNE
jgi:hypothetical protein